MSIAERILFLGLALLLLEAEATSRLGGGHGVADDGDQDESGGDQSVFNVKSYGAQADGQTNDGQVSSDTILIEINRLWLPYAPCYRLLE